MRTPRQRRNTRSQRLRTARRTRNRRSQRLRTARRTRNRRLQRLRTALRARNRRSQRLRTALQKILTTFRLKGSPVWGATDHPRPSRIQVPNGVIPPSHQTWTIASMRRGSAWEVDVGSGGADGEAPVAAARCASPRATEGWSLPSGATGHRQANGTLACVATSQVTRLRLHQRAVRMSFQIVQAATASARRAAPEGSDHPSVARGEAHRAAATGASPSAPPVSPRPFTPNPGASTQSSRFDVTVV